MRDLNIKLVQANLVWEHGTATLAHLETLIGKGVEEIVMLPEMFATGFTMQPEKFAQKMDGKAVRWMKENSENRVICGSLSIVEDGHYYNRFLWAENGEIKYTYDKHHLFSHGEEHKHYSAGTERILIEYMGWKILPLVCYDLRFPAWCRNTVDADVMLFVANWPKVRIKAWERLLPARAIENQCYVAAVNRVGTDGNGVGHNGCSAAYDPWGDVMARNEGAETVISVALNAEKLQLFRKEFPVLEDRDEFDWVS